MHEMALAEEVVRIVEETAGRSAACAVRTVVLEIGRLSSVEPEALRFCFAAAARGTIVEESALEIVEVSGAGTCLACGATVPMDESWGECPVCAGGVLQPSAGTGMRVREIEVA
jgi:hydrogenase nickel incorporation protein HypA/HybF